MLRTVFDPSLARAFGILWLAGFVIFEIMAILTFRHAGSVASAPFVAAAVILFVLGLWTFWRHPWALAIGALLSAAQIPATIGCIRDLRAGEFMMKGSFLTAGIDPSIALWGHAVYSLVGSALFVWALVRYILLRAANRPGDVRR
jgi:hypothetical protein